MNEAKVSCLCADTATHDGDTVVFREKLDFRTLAIARKTIAWLNTENPGTGVPDILGVLSEFYLLHCIESWTVRDAKNKPVPVTQANVRAYLLEPAPWVAMDLAEVADSIYSGTVMVPLVVMASRSSRPTPTNGSTSATNGTGRKPTRSKRSSTTTSLTDGTAATPA